MPSLSYLRSSWKNYSIVKATAYSFVLTFLLLFLVHVSIIASRVATLHSYTEGKHSGIQEVVFQVNKGLKATQIGQNEPCSDADLEFLRELKRTYFFIGDLGRISGNRIICTVLNGTLATPVTLPPIHTKTSGGIEYRNSQDILFYSEKKKPTITYKNAVLFLSPAYLIDAKHGYIGIHGFGGVTYIDSNPRYVINYFGGILPDELDHFLGSVNSLSDLLPLPNRVKNETLCNSELEVCMTAIYQRIGLFGLSDKVLSTVAASAIILGIGLGFIVEYFRVGPRAFLRDLKKQIRHDTIYPVYQPQVNIATQEVVGVESLARWHDSIQGHVSPEVFIQAAEDFKLIDTLTQKLIVKVFHDLHELMESNSSFKVSVNISADLLTSHTFVDFLNQLISQYRFERNQVVLEVTERSVSNNSQMSEFSRKLKEQGYLVSIDDFGTGVSNLSWLSMLEPNEIKVDKLFTHSIETQTVNNITLNGIFGMLEHLDVRVVFEGIETQEQLSYILKKIPTAIGQGWLFAKPQKIEELKRFLDPQHGQRLESEAIVSAV